MKEQPYYKIIPDGLENPFLLFCKAAVLYYTAVFYDKLSQAAI